MQPLLVEPLALLRHPCGEIGFRQAVLEVGPKQSLRGEPVQGGLAQRDALVPQRWVAHGPMVQSTAEILHPVEKRVGPTKDVIEIAQGAEVPRFHDVHDALPGRQPQTAGAQLIVRLELIPRLHLIIDHLQAGPVRQPAFPEASERDPHPVFIGPFDLQAKLGNERSSHLFGRQKILRQLDKLLAIQDEIHRYPPWVIAVGGPRASTSRGRLQVGNVYHRRAAPPRALDEYPSSSRRLPCARGPQPARPTPATRTRTTGSIPARPSPRATGS